MTYKTPFVQLRNNAAMPQASHCSVNVVLLAGSHNTRFVSDIQAKAAAETLQKDPTANNIRRTKVCKCRAHLHPQRG